MFDRIIGGILLLPLSIVLITGGNLLYVVGYILSILGLKELFSGFKNKGFNPIISFAMISCNIVLISNIFELNGIIKFIMCFVVFVYGCFQIILNKHNIIDFGVTILGILYIVIPFECIIEINKFNINSFNLSWLVFIIAFSNDISAYLIGKNFGRKKLIPSVSPNKTVEGSIGGIFGTVLVVSIISYIFNFNMFTMGVVAVLGSVLSQTGDLFASAIKRYVGLKDFSKMIPGHGGIIDRFDSVFFVTPLVLILTLFI